MVRSGVLEDIHRNFIAYQLICALAYLKKMGITHGSFRLATILVNSECIIRIADFSVVRRAESSDLFESHIPYDLDCNPYRAPELVPILYSTSSPLTTNLFYKIV